MKREGKFKKFIKDPGKWLWAFYGALFLTAGALTATALLWNASNPVVYVLSAVLLALFIYCLIFTIKYARAFFKRKMRSHKITSRFVDDYSFRTIVLSSVSFIINVAYVVFQTVMAIINKSLWYGTFAVYYALLGFIRGSAVWADVRADRLYKDDEAARLKGKLRIYLWCGILLILLSAALSAALGYMIVNDISFRYRDMTIFVVAVYAFYKIVTAITNLAKARKFKDYGVQSLRNINLTDALVSIFALQTALLATFGGEDDGSRRPLNASMALIICLLTLGMGVYMIVKSVTVMKKNKGKEGAAAAAGADEVAEEDAEKDAGEAAVPERIGDAEECAGKEELQ